MIKYIILCSIFLLSCKPELNLQEIENHISNEEYDEALTKLNSKKYYKTTNFLYYRMRGYCNMNKGNFHEAINDFNLALKIKKNDTISYYFKALAFDSLQVFDSALINYLKSQKLNSYSNLAIFNNIGILYQRVNNDHLALLYFNSSISVDSNFYIGYNNAGQSYDNRQQYDSAIFVYSKAIQLIKTESYLYFNRAMSYYNTGNLQSCKMDLDTAIIIDKNPLYIINRGVVNAENKQFKEACEDFKTAYKMGLIEAIDYLNQYCK